MCKSWPVYNISCRLVVWITNLRHQSSAVSSLVTGYSFITTPQASFRLALVPNQSLLSVVTRWGWLEDCVWSLAVFFYIRWLVSHYYSSRQYSPLQRFLEAQAVKVIIMYPPSRQCDYQSPILTVVLISRLLAAARSLLPLCTNTIYALPPLHRQLTQTQWSASIYILISTQAALPVYIFWWAVYCIQPLSNLSTDTNFLQLPVWERSLVTIPAEALRV